jgi:hypothetical protein
MIYTEDVLDAAKEVSKSDEIENTEIAFDIDGMKDVDLAVARIPITSAKAATTRINSYADDKLASKIEETGTFKLNNTVFHVNKGYKYKTIDLPGFLNWLLEGNASASAMGDLSAVLGYTFVPKLRGLDAVAEKRGMKAQVARDTFLERVIDDKSKLAVINCDTASAPKWAVGMKDGDRLERS